MSDETELRDRLAVQRTRLANERTLLAYIRTALGLVIVGVGAMELFVTPLGLLIGWMVIGCSLVVMIIGFSRFAMMMKSLSGGH